MAEVLYPKSPTDVPKNITSLPSSYQLRAFLAVLAILLFFILYAALVTALGYLVYYAIIYDMGRINKLTILMKIGAIAGSVMLFVFTLKFIFKLKNNKPNNRIKLKKQDYPKLWEFVNKICKETGAPKPKNIYVDPDVNAYVAYSNMWLSLFLPVRKELTIGMGLVDCLNFSEFKAVVAHEFGHFAQRSMKIGSYIISANTIIHDMIFSRDKWDDLLDQWRASDIRLSAAAWGITPIIWIIRQILNLFYQFLNIMYSSLSREMEFNADKVAISTSGSDSIISALWKLESGYTHWNNTMNHAYLASQKKLYTENLYNHNALAIEKNLPQQETLLNNLPTDSRGGKTFFSSSEHSKVSMYASHPPNDKRQDNAKTPFIKCEIDERSPWLLFDKQEHLQKEMTKLVYDVYFNKKDMVFSEADTFETFVATENQGKTLLEDYDNTFENRYLQIPEEQELKEESILIETSTTYLKQLKTKLKDLMQPVRDIEALMTKASNISQGTTKETSFSFHNKTFKKKNLQEGYNLLITEREKLFNESFKDWDSSFCALHYALAKKASKTDTLINLYKQHTLLSNIYRNCVQTKSTIYSELNRLQNNEEVTHAVINSFKHRINDLFDNLNEDLAKLDHINFVKLPNIDTVDELKEVIVAGGSFEKGSGNIFENGAFNKMMTDLENATVHCQRIDQKSVGVILAFHNELQDNLD
ncbi:M48 family metallopeptidase [Hyunsoonleella ulvae]|uniref:M48 family metallopeptidase n=2 Tax=Flavobacteriaceae TaxID=49546 RepID=UPI0019395130|nr:M48 family metallopeptidase [Hyunsoonleella ulvae]